MIKWFATRRELARLVKDADFWRKRALALEKELKSQDSYYREYILAVFDRFLTGVVKVPAIRDEVKASVTDHGEEKKFHELERRVFLEDKLDQLKEWAREAGKSPEDAQVVYDQNLTAYELEFEAQHY